MATPKTTPEPEHHKRLQYAELSANLLNEAFHPIITDQLRGTAYNILMRTAARKAHQPCPLCYQSARHAYYWRSLDGMHTQIWVQCRDCGHMEKA